MGSDNAAANDHPEGKSWCLPTLVGLISGALLTAYGAVVLIADVAKLLG